MLLELDMPARTTRDYRGPLVAPRYQAALEAALTPQESEISVNAAPAAAEARFRVRASRTEQPSGSVMPVLERMYTLLRSAVGCVSDHGRMDGSDYNSRISACLYVCSSVLPCFHYH